MDTKNNFFDAGRFGMYLRLQWTTYRRSILFAGLLLYGLLLFTDCWYASSSYDSYYHHAYAGYDSTWTFVDGSSYFYLVVIAALLGNRSFHVLGTKSGRQSFFMLPVSTFEKFLSSWLGIVVLLVAGFGVVVLADLTRVAVFTAMYGQADFVLPVPWFVDRVEVDCLVFSSFLGSFRAWLGLLLISSFMQLGAVCWQRLAALKTGLVLFGGALLVTFTIFQLMRLLFAPEFYYPRWEWMEEFFFNSERGLVLLMGIVTLFNGVITYFRLKETEIIHRL